MKNKLIYVLTLVFLACALLFGGCGKTEESAKAPEEKTAIAEQKKDMAEKETEAVPQKTVVDEAATGQPPEKVVEQPTEEVKNICSLSVRCETALANKDKLSAEIDGLIENLKKYSEAIKANDEQTLFDLLEEGSSRKVKIDGFQNK